MRWGVVVMVMGLVLALTGLAEATPPFMGGHRQELVSEPPQAGFGMSVDVNGGALLVGSVVLGKEAPEAFVFKLRGERWVQVARLQPPREDGAVGAGRAYPVQVGLGAELAAVRAGDRVFFYREREGEWRLTEDSGADRRVWNLDVDGRSVALLSTLEVVGDTTSWLEVWRMEEGGHRREPIALQLSPGVTATSVALRGNQLVVGAGCNHVGCSIGGELVVLELDAWGRWREVKRWQAGEGPISLGHGVAWGGDGVLATAPFGMDDGQRVGWLGAWTWGRTDEAPIRTAWLSGRPGELGGPVMGSIVSSLGAFGDWAVTGLHFDREPPLRGGYALLHAGARGWEVKEVVRGEQTHLGFSAAMGPRVMAVGSPRLDGGGPGQVVVRW